MARAHAYERRVTWSDCDAAGMWRFASALTFVEEAEVSLLREAGVLAVLYGRLPRAHVEARFHTAAAFDPLALALFIRTTDGLTIPGMLASQLEDLVADQLLRSQPEWYRWQSAQILEVPLGSPQATAESWDSSRPTDASADRESFRCPDRWTTSDPCLAQFGMSLCFWMC